MSNNRFGLTCECQMDGEVVRGEISDLSYTGFFMATTEPFEPGQEFVLRIVGGATPEPIYLSGIVESCVNEGSLTADSGPGVHFRLLRLSRDYGELVMGEGTTRHQSKLENQRSHSTRREGEREWLSCISESADESSSNERALQQEWEEWEKCEPLPELTGVPLRREDSLAPDAIVIDDGELDDVVRVLAEIGIKAERQSPESDSFFTNWIRPRHLLIATAKRALRHRLPLQAETQSFVSIAVADCHSRMLCSAMRRLGYQYAISRPIHSRAMLMLFRQVIFDQHEQRTMRREVLVCSVLWWCGWGSKRPGVILDMSSGGCQMLVRDAVKPDSKIKVRVPAGVAGGPEFTLVGKVIRSIREDRGTSLGISFGDQSVKVQRRLEQVLALPGPCPLEGDPLLLEHETEILEGREAEEVSLRDRRVNFRAALHQEIVALEHDSSRVMHVLFSCDLTVDGMRVEAHPALAVGDQLDLALYEDSDGGPLILAAVVARDDGRRGWWLRFVDVSDQARERLAKALDRFPPVTRLEGPESELGRVVLSQVVLSSVSRRKDDRT
jgi:hypothetical protein